MRPVGLHPARLEVVPSGTRKRAEHARLTCLRHVYPGKGSRASFTGSHPCRCKVPPCGKQVAGWCVTSALSASGTRSRSP